MYVRGVIYPGMIDHTFSSSVSYRIAQNSAAEQQQQRQQQQQWRRAQLGGAIPAAVAAAAAAAESTASCEVSCEGVWPKKEVRQTITGGHS